MTLFGHVPAKQKHFLNSDYSIINKCRKDHYKDIGVVCPICRTSLPPLEHGVQLRCKKCHTYMIRYGNSLTVCNSPFDKEINPHQSPFIFTGKNK